MAYGQGGWRRRNMYRLTGLPGWMRFGYSPGWVGRSPTGLPPMAQYLMQKEQSPQVAPYTAQGPFPESTMPSEEQEIQMLKYQAEMLEQQLEQVKKRLEELGKT